MTRAVLFARGAAMFAAAAALRTPAKSAQFEFKCGTNNPVDHPSSIGLGRMWAAVEQQSGGRVHVQFYPNNSLGSESAMFSQLRLGALQFQLISAGNLASVVPAADVGFLGFAFRDAEEGLRVMDGALGDYVRGQIASKGMFALHSIWDQGMNQVGSVSHPIRTPDDMHGFKIRVMESKITVDLFKALGASPTPLPFPEVYTGLQTKVIDGEAAPLVTIETSRFYEVQQYVSLTNHSWSGSWLIANGDAWKSMPPDLQDLIEKNHTRYVGVARRDGRSLNAADLARLRGHGTVVNQVDPTPFRSLLRPYYENWAGVFGAAEWSALESSLGRKLL